ncbi:MAG: sugar-binding protein [Rhodobacteraceae bacterium]|nr:sugar-binding protein [Paracoccaceae bacterium]
MKKVGLYAAAAAVAVVGATSAFAEEMTFALVPKLTAHPFFELTRDGCMEAAERLDVTCDYRGPQKYDEAEQVQVVRDLITKGVDGLAISPANAQMMQRVIDEAVAAGIPTITYDADSPGSARALFVGTDNVLLGLETGKLISQLRPQGGTIALITGGLAADNLNQRLDGIRQGIGDGWTIVDGSPFATNDDPAVGNQVITDLLIKYPDLNAIAIAGGWPMFAPEAFKKAVEPAMARMGSGEFVLVAGDSLDMQLELVKAGYANGVVGQRPIEMGSMSMEILLGMTQGKTFPDPSHTGVDIITAENVDEFLK